MDYIVEQIEVTGQPTAVVRGLVREDEAAAFLGGAFGEILGVIEAQGLRPDGMPFGCYLPTSDGIQIEAGFPTSAPVEPAGRVEPASLPAGPAVLVVHKGPYQAVVAAYEAANSWIAEHDWETTGPPWEAYLDGPEVPEPRTVVYLPCRPR